VRLRRAVREGLVALAGLSATTLAYRNFSTPAHQLREPQ
jgi:hypothetical protein